MARVHTWRLFCAECGKGMHKSPTSLPQGRAKCRNCRRASRPEPKPKVPGYGTKSRRDCEVCGHQYRAKQKEQRTCGRTCGVELKRLSMAPKLSPVEWTPCSVCDTWMSRTRVVCSEACRVIRNRQTTQDWYLLKRNELRRTITCLHCKATYCWIGDGRGWPRYCSDTCQIRARSERRKTDVGKNDRQRARFFGVQYEPIDRRRVYERDRWRCGLCGKGVRRDVKAPHPLSPSLDHVVPLSRGGDHLYANVQCAHFKCNWMKGDGGSQQLALVG